MRVDFIKMHGAGNDFVILDERARPLEIDAFEVRRIADRRRGVGCDQVVRLRPATASGADALMIIHNADGSMSSTCGNATRCVAALLADGEPRDVVIETLAGLLDARVTASGDVTVDMGCPRLDGRSVGLADPDGDTLHLDLPGDPAACSMGNPHATVFVVDLDDVEVGRRGPALGGDAMFADGVNAGFAQVLDHDRIRLRVWERGAGLTLACGSGACAALVNAHRRGLAGRRAALLLDGGTLGIEWREADGHVLMTGPAETAFTGTLEL